MEEVQTEEHLGQDTVLLEHEELFPEDESEITDTMDVTKKVWLVRHVEKQIDQLQLQDQQSRAFYADRIAKAQGRIESIKLRLLGFLQFHQLKNIQTPAGTVYQKAVASKRWPADDVLLTWADAYVPDAVRIKREASKKLIGEHIQKTGEIPDGYSEVQETRLYIK